MTSNMNEPRPRSPLCSRALLAGACSLLSAACSLQDFDALDDGVVGGESETITPGLSSSAGMGGSFGMESSAEAVAGQGGTSIEGEPSGNLVEDSSFEERDDLVGWVQHGDGAITRIEEDCFDGNACLRSEGRALDWNGPLFALVPGSLTPGIPYSVRALVRSDQPGSIKLTQILRCEGFDESVDSPYSRVVEINVAASTWTPMTGTVLAGDCTILEQSLYFEGPPAGGTIDIDQFSISPE